MPRYVDGHVLPVPFDVKRIVYGGFKILVDV